MQYKVLNAKTKVFGPVTIQITFETQKELDDFAAMSNACFISDRIKLPHYSFFEELGGNLEDSCERLWTYFMHDIWFSSKVRATKTTI